MNYTIVEIVRCMLSHAKLPRTFWGETMKTVVDLVNLSPFVSWELDIPDRMWTEKDVFYEHLKMLGARHLCMFPQDERGKLDDKANKFIFQGYGHEEFDYRLWGSS